MNVKVIVGGLIVVVFLVFGAMSFMDSNVEYTDIAGAKQKGKKVQLKGTWNRDRESSFDASTGRFSFYLRDDQGLECRVLLDGAAPNNFELATSVVAKGKFTPEGYFHATEVLTKCPSKYEAEAAELNKAKS
jgi:cytochrome c-type biogenesis protein CcmE